MTAKEQALFYFNECSQENPEFSVNKLKQCAKEKVRENKEIREKKDFNEDYPEHMTYFDAVIHEINKL